MESKRCIMPGARIKDLPWEPSGLILDPFAGRKKWWIGADLIGARLIFVDRYYIEPGTICASVTKLPFQDASFDQVWADPPHLIRKYPMKNSIFVGKDKKTAGTGRCYFGTYPSRAAVHAEWSAAAAELHRVTKQGGILVWKSIDGAKTVNQCINDSDLTCLTPWWTPIDRVSARSRVTWSTARVVYTLWKRRTSTYDSPRSR